MLSDFVWQQIISGYAAVALLIGYALVSLGWRKPDDLSPTLLNLTAGIAWTWANWQAQIWPGVIVNVFWAGIAVYSLIRYFRRR